MRAPLDLPSTSGHISRVFGELLAKYESGPDMLDPNSPKMRLLRGAWSAFDRSLDRDELAELADAEAAPPFLIIDVDKVGEGVVFPPLMARLALNLVLLGAEAVGGPGRVTFLADTRHEIVLSITGPAAAWPEGIMSVLHDIGAAEAALGKRQTAKAGVTALLARDAGARLSLLLPTGRTDGGTVPPLRLQMPT